MSPSRSGKLAVSLAILGILAGAGYGWYRYTFPYGRSHCCLKQIGLALGNYADLNNGHFPAGEKCPEASLSLLHRYPFDVSGRVLCGKTKSAARADEILARGQLLGPDSCDWHYVEGLTLSDDPRIALVWDKVGLGHNGQRLPGGGHTVWRLRGPEERIPGSEWQKFRDEQERLMAARPEAAKKGLPVLTAKVRLPSGEVVDQYDAQFSLLTTIAATDVEHVSTHESKTYTTGGSQYSAGPCLHASVLRWHKLEDGSHTYVLSLNGWKSSPVTVRVSQGVAVPDAVIFQMQ